MTQHLPSSLPARSRQAQILVLAKAPVPGRVKTRLSPPYTSEQAAALAAAALRDTVRAVAGADAVRRVLVLDGDLPRGLLPNGFELRAQTDGGLSRRLEHALLEAWVDLPVPVLLVGMDTPQASAADIDSALDTLFAAGTDAVLGPAGDGGFWTIGLRRPRPGLVEGVPMSRDDTGALQRTRLETAGLIVRDVPEMRDVDEAADALAVAVAAPTTEFAATVRRFDLRDACDADAEGAA